MGKTAFDKAIKDALTFTTSTDKRGFLNVTLDMGEVRTSLYEADKAVKQTVSDKEALGNMAWTLIYSTEAEGLIPYKTKYTIRKPQDKDPDAPNYRKDIKKHIIKRGKNKGKLKNDKFTPTQYYSYKDLKYQKPRTNYYSDAYGNMVMYSEPAKTRERAHWYEVESNPEYNKSFSRAETDVWRTDKKSGKQYKTKIREYYSDRPPHLSEVEATHKVIIKKGNAQITIHNRKPKDERFTEIGGQEYALAQYFGDDADWKRETSGSTSRWLEVAAGLVEPQRPVTVNVNKNIQAMSAIMNKQLAKRLGGKK